MLNLMNGIAVGTVTNNSDPDGLGRVQVQIGSLGQNSEKYWCSVASVAAGGDRGIFFMPEKNDEVLIAFNEGDFDHPFVIGYPWNPVQTPPSTHYQDHVIKTKSGHSIRLIDSQENGGTQGAVIIQDAHNNMITMTNGRMTIKATGLLDLQATTILLNGRPLNNIGGEI
ncbi:MAG: phage baseplate assembly protein V [Pseudomonadota bacterium]